MSDYDHLFKVIAIGNAGVGKTTFLERIVYNEFRPNRYVCTIGVEFYTKMYEIGDKKIKLYYWDTAGQEKFVCVSRSYYRGANFIFLVFDLSDVKSFEKVEFWYKELIQNYEKLPPIFLIGSKSDLKQEVSERMIVKLANKLGNLPVYYCSSLNGSGVNKLIHDFTIEMLQNEPVDVKIEIKQETKQETNWYCYLV